MPKSGGERSGAKPARRGARWAARGGRRAEPDARGRSRAPEAVVPPARPRLGSAELDALLAPHAIDRARYPVLVVGIRGYYMKTLGDPASNDRGIYDDAIFLSSPSAMAAFNGNVDPSAYRPGHGVGAEKGMASLKPGAWFVHRFDKHRGKYLALCQRAGPVTVVRDGENGPYETTGLYGINIHRGGYTTTSSEGCQTIHPSQWESFIALAVDQAKRYHGEAWKDAVIPYVLLANG